MLEDVLEDQLVDLVDDHQQRRFVGDLERGSRACCACRGAASERTKSPKGSRAALEDARPGADGLDHEHSRQRVLRRQGRQVRAHASVQHVARIGVLGRRAAAATITLRLTAIRSPFRYAAVRHPEHAAVIGRVLSIPAKRYEQRTVTFLTAD